MHHTTPKLTFRIENNYKTRKNFLAQMYVGDKIRNRTVKVYDERWQKQI